MPRRELLIKAIALATADAYSHDRYSEEGWKECIHVLLQRTDDRLEVEAFLRSKHMRWAGDMEMRDGVDYGDLDGVTLTQYISKNPAAVSKDELLQLKQEALSA